MTLKKTALEYKEKEELAGVEVIVFSDASAFETWLGDNYQRAEGVWLKIAKKNSGISSLTDSETVDIGLCWGWISGQRRSYDQSYYLQKYVPRRARSIWSQINVDKVKKLTKAGRMQPSGLAEVAAAKADGRWDAAYVSQHKATVPDDLTKALKKNKAAAQFFAQLGKTDRYLIILSILKERSPEGRSERVKKIVANLSVESHKDIKTEK